MKLDCVLTATDENTLYSEFIPIFIRMWKQLAPETDIKIIYIAHTLPERFEKYKEHIILFPPIDGVLTPFISQYVRILYPSLMEYKGGVMITDMDMLPMNSKYYIDNIKDFSDDKFVYLRDWFSTNEIAICYNVAAPSTWREINGINTMDDLTKRIKESFNKVHYTGVHGGPGWCTDQIDLRAMVWAWEGHSKRFVHLKDETSGYRRLDRMGFYLDPYIVKLIKDKQFTDFHALRPYQNYKQINDLVAEILCNPELKIQFS